MPGPRADDEIEWLAPRPRLGAAHEATCRSGAGTVESFDRPVTSPGPTQLGPPGSHRQKMCYLTEGLGSNGGSVRLHCAVSHEEADERLSQYELNRAQIVRQHK